MASLNGQYLILGVPGTSLDDDTRALIREIQPGGFILFGRNIKDPTELRQLTDELRSLVSIEPVITIDQEGGRVSRLKEIGSEPPSAKQLRDKGDGELIARHGSLTGKLLRLFGFNLDLCPVLDISFDDEADNSLRNRTYGKTPEQVILHARQFNSAMRAEGILSCGKHFPGYSAAGVDPHHELPSIPRTRAELEATEWKPFKALLNEIDSIMVAHASYKNLDPSGISSSLSNIIVNGILKNEWNYNGLVMTDDIDMGAILNEYGFEETLKMAIKAGNDMILLCHRTAMGLEAAKILADLPESVARPAQDRISTFKSKLAKPTAFSLQNFKALDDQVYKLREDTLGAQAAQHRSADDGKRSPVEVY